MSERNASWFKFYPADFMNGVRGLSAQEVGLYTMILCRIYEESGPVEYNPLRLSTYAGMREPTFVKTCEKLIALGKLHLIDGRLTNTRAEAEISNRANDLKNSSKAGKASAQKRQQNQSKSSTPVQQAFNHTDTDTDTDTDKYGGGGYAREATASLREKVLEAMGIGPEGVTSAGRFIGGQGDMAELDRWLNLPGLSSQVVIDELRRVTAAKADGPPKSFKYYTPAMQRLSADLTAPPLQPAPQSNPQATPYRSRRDERLAAERNLASIPDRIRSGEITIDTRPSSPW